MSVPWEALSSPHWIQKQNIEEDGRDVQTKKRENI